MHSGNKALAFFSSSHINVLVYSSMFFSQSILFYGSMDTTAQCLVTLRNPEGCPILCLKHSGNFLFAGLRDGTLMVYGRHHGGTSYIMLDVSLYLCGVGHPFFHILHSCCLQVHLKSSYLWVSSKLSWIQVGNEVIKILIFYTWLTFFVAFYPVFM